MNRNKIIQSFRKAHSEFQHIYYDYLGSVYDCVFGLNILVRKADELLYIRMEDIAEKNYKRMHDYSHVFSFQKDKGNMDTIYYVTSGPDIFRRIETKQNESFLSSMFIVFIFQIWEDVYRKKIALSLKITPNDVKIPIMGDINKIRNSIIHNRGVANKDINKCEILKQFRYGDKIIFTSELLWQIKKEIEMGFEMFEKEIIEKYLT